MLFHSSLRKELARSFGATLVVLATIVMTMMLVRTLGQASRGNVDPSEVMMVMGFTVLGQLPIILTLSLFIASVMTLSRMYADSEMVIWFASGRGLAALLQPMLRFAWPILLAVALLALLAWPWSNRQLQDMRDRYEKRGDLERVAPGQFQESSSGQRVFFIDKASGGGKDGSNVFIAASDHGKDAVTSARSARVESVDHRSLLLLRNGQRLETTQGQPDLKLSEFTEYGTYVGNKTLGPQDAVPAKSRATLDLLLEPSRSNLGEFAWRLGLALAACNLIVLAVAVAHVNPRAGRSASLAFALFAFMLYYNLLNLGQSWIAAGSLSLGAVLIGLHGGALALGLGWLVARHNQWSWRALGRKAAP